MRLRLGPWWPCSLFRTSIYIIVLCVWAPNPSTKPDTINSHYSIKKHDVYLYTVHMSKRALTLFAFHYFTRQLPIHSHHTRRLTYTVSAQIQWHQSIFYDFSAHMLQMSTHITHIESAQFSCTKFKMSSILHNATIEMKWNSEKVEKMAKKERKFQKFTEEQEMEIKDQPISSLRSCCLFTVSVHRDLSFATTHPFFVSFHFRTFVLCPSLNANVWLYFIIMTIPLWIDCGQITATESPARITKHTESNQKPMRTCDWAHISLLCCVRSLPRKKKPLTAELMRLAYKMALASHLQYIYISETISIVVHWICCSAIELGYISKVRLLL